MSGTTSIRITEGLPSIWLRIGRRISTDANVKVEDAGRADASTAPITRMAAHRWCILALCSGMGNEVLSSLKRHVAARERVQLDREHYVVGRGALGEGPVDEPDGHAVAPDAHRIIHFGQL